MEKEFPDNEVPTLLCQGPRAPHRNVREQSESRDNRFTLLGREITFCRETLCRGSLQVKTVTQNRFSNAHMFLWSPCKHQNSEPVCGFQTHLSPAPFTKTGPTFGLHVQCWILGLRFYPELRRNVECQVVTWMGSTCPPLNVDFFPNHSGWICSTYRTWNTSELSTAVDQVMSSLTCCPFTVLPRLLFVHRRSSTHAHFLRDLKNSGCHLFGEARRGRKVKFLSSFCFVPLM